MHTSHARSTSERGKGEESGETDRFGDDAKFRLLVWRSRSARVMNMLGCRAKQTMGKWIDQRVDEDRVPPEGAVWTGGFGG